MMMHGLANPKVSGMYRVCPDIVSSFFTHSLQCKKWKVMLSTQ